MHIRDLRQSNQRETLLHTAYEGAPSPMSKHPVAPGTGRDEMKITSDYLGLVYDSAEIEGKYGTVNFNGKKLYLIQQAYYTGDETYGSIAIDEEGNDYRVNWETSDAWKALDPEQREDEGDACDWDIYTVTPK